MKILSAGSSTTKGVMSLHKLYSVKVYRRNIKKWTLFKMLGEEMGTVKYCYTS